MKEIHFTRKDFTVQWFSGQGGGGQHRNKHANCCRIIHNQSGLRAQSTKHRERVANQRDAFRRLAKLLIAYYCAGESAPRRTDGERVRTYHAVRNEVHDMASGFRMSYGEVVDGANIGPMIDARRNALSGIEE